MKVFDLYTQIMDENSLKMWEREQRIADFMHSKRDKITACLAILSAFKEVKQNNKLHNYYEKI